MHSIERYSITFLVILAASIVSGCKNFSVKDRVDYANTLVSEKNWIAVDIDTRQFILRTYHAKAISPKKYLWVYIEGDGFAWVTRSQPSLDPTPLNPIALKMALNQPEGNAVYLARPCQFILEANSNCAQTYWTQKRFSKEVINASFDAIESLKKLYQAEKLILVGYSGGGSIASVISAMRNDVSYLITVAGNLDPTAWTNFHKITPLQSAINPAHFIKELSSVKQIHLAGGKDTVMPPQLLFGYRRKFPEGSNIQVKVIQGYDHHCCWAEHWPNTWRETLIKQIDLKN